MNKFAIIFVFTICLGSSLCSAGKVIYNFSYSGMSMYPAMSKGMYKVVTAEKSDVSIGDVICFNYDKRNYKTSCTRYKCHRIIDYTDDHVCTKGDNNPRYDQCVEWKYVALKVLI